VHTFINRQHERARSGQGYSFAHRRRSHRRRAGSGRSVAARPWTRKRRLLGRCLGSPPWSRSARVATGVGVGLTLTGLHRLKLYAEPWNEGSWRAAKRAGYVREGLLHSWEQIGDRRRVGADIPAGGYRHAAEESRRTGPTGGR
jgi:hypothetical protein